MAARNIPTKKAPSDKKKAAAPDTLVKRGKAKAELSEDELKKVSGGYYVKIQG